MNLSNVAQILAAVGAASEFGGDMPCQNEVLDAAFCIIKTGQGGVNDAGEMSEMGGALSCLMCPQGNANPDINNPPESLTCDDIQIPAYCSDVDECVQANCDSTCATETSAYIQCMEDYISTACGNGNEICPQSRDEIAVAKKFLRHA